MKKDNISELLINILAKRKQKLLADKKIKEAKDKLSIQDKNSYEELVKKRKVYLEFGFTKGIFKIFIFVLLFFGGAIFYFGDISNLNSFKEISRPLFVVFLRVLLLALIMDILSFLILPLTEIINIRKLDRRLFLKK